MELKAVLFDLDGVITDSAKYHFQAWNKCAERLGFAIDESFNESLKGVDRCSSLRLLLAHGNRSLSDADFEEALTCKNEDYLQLIQGMNEDDILPGIKNLLVELKHANIACILCSASKNAPLILERLQLRDAFQGIVNPETLPQGKPAPDIFLRGAQMAQVAVCNCIGIEDAKAGIEAIKAAQMKAIGIGQELCLTKADVVVDSTANLSLALLKESMN